MAIAIAQDLSKSVMSDAGDRFSGIKRHFISRVRTGFKLTDASDSWITLLDQVRVTAHRARWVSTANRRVDCRDPAKSNRLVAVLCCGRGRYVRKGLRTYGYDT